VLVKKLYYENKFGTLFPKKVIEFTDRELKVMSLICEEKTTSEIAKAIFTSDRTIDGIRRSLLSKIGAKNTIGIALYALRENIIFKED
jgi:DNA-binding NarL/FixJ family response regulator